MKKFGKPLYKIGDTVVLTMPATSVIKPEYGLGCATVKISEVEQDSHFGPCYRFENTDGCWPESSIAYCKQGVRV